jgi:hypothetical protein
MEDVGKSYGHLAYFTPIWYILRLFGIFYGYLVHFSQFWYVVICNLATLMAWLVCHETCYQAARTDK